MRAVLSPLILLFAGWFAGAVPAQASPVFAPALSDSELAANSAGRSFSIRFEERAATPLASAGLNPLFAPPFFGIQTIVLDSGTASVDQAITAVTLQATLKGIEF